MIQAEDDGRTFDVAKGSGVTFKLASHAGNGYLWTLANDDAGLESVPQLVQQGDRTSEVSSDVPGAAKTDVYRFVAKVVGTASIEMDLKRPLGDAPPAKTLRVTIHVHFDPSNHSERTMSTPVVAKRQLGRGGVEVFPLSFGLHVGMRPGDLRKER